MSKKRMMPDFRRCLKTWEDFPLFLKPSELALFLGCSEQSIRKQCADGTLPAFKIDQKNWRINRDLARTYYEDLMKKTSKGVDSIGI